MNVEVVSASKFRQKAVEAPSAVSVITSADIKTYGYRTLADVLRSVRGLYVSNDRFYDYIGVRGFKPPGDYSSRILLLVNGYRVNDPVYDAAAIGDDFMVDMALVDRIEIVRGPGSSVYGSNAFFAVVNVITKSGGDIGGLHLSVGGGGFGVDQESVTFGKQFGDGASVLLSASRMHRAGADLFFPEFNTPETNNGIATNLDWTESEQYLAKIDYGGFSLTAIHSRRDRGLPAAPFGIIFNDPNAHWIDEYTFADLSRYDQLDSRWSLASRVFYGLYLSYGYSPYGPPEVMNRDYVRGEAWGGELKLLSQLGRHKLVLGVEYQDNLHQDQKNYDADPFALFLDDKRSSQRVGLYGQDEFTLSSALTFNAGVRYDHYSGVGDTINPRLALLWKPGHATTVKALYGSAFRAPSDYELYYNDGGTAYKANPSLKPEKIRTYELVLEHYFDPQFQLTVDGYYNIMGNLITQQPDPADGLLVFENTGGANAKGVEVELERVWNSGVRLRASYAWQISRDKLTDLELADSPRSMAKLNFSFPVFKSAARVGAEMQYTSRRLTLTGGSAGAYLLTNLTLTTDRLPGGVGLSASLYNVFGVRYFDPGGAGPRSGQDPAGRPQLQDHPGSQVLTPRTNQRPGGRAAFRSFRPGSDQADRPCWRRPDTSGAGSERV